MSLDYYMLSLGTFKKHKSYSMKNLRDTSHIRHHLKYIKNILFVHSFFDICWSMNNWILFVLCLISNVSLFKCYSISVHDEPLLGVIRVCYNIALNRYDFCNIDHVEINITGFTYYRMICSKSPINQATSKAMLTQMINIIFRRMETDIVSLDSFILLFLLRFSFT